MSQLAGDVEIPPSMKFWEHLANTLTHAIMIPPSIVAIVWMVNNSTTGAQMWASFVYGIPLLIVFCCSAFYHLMAMVWRHDAEHRRTLKLLRLADRMVIFLFIAASYSPWLMLRDYGLYGVCMRYIIWMFAFAGMIYYQSPLNGRYPALESILYVLMGVGPVPVLMLGCQDYGGVVLLAAGGAAYISGLFFFHADGKIPFAHAFWHIHVVLGVVLHFMAVAGHLLGPDKGEQAKWTLETTTQAENRMHEL